MKLIVTLVIACAAIVLMAETTPAGPPIGAAGRAAHSHKAPSPPPAQTPKGTIKRHGTPVQHHGRSPLDKKPKTDYQTKHNINPFTGKSQKLMSGPKK